MVKNAPKLIRPDRLGDTLRRPHPLGRGRYEAISWSRAPTFSSCLRHCFAAVDFHSHL